MALFAHNEHPFRALADDGVTLATQVLVLVKRITKFFRKPVRFLSLRDLDRDGIVTGGATMMT
jgi:hypothetical protein